MKAEIKEIESWKRRVDVEVDAEEISPFVKETLADYQKKVQIDGFRKGKAPLHLIRKQFGPAIVEDVAERLVEAFFAQAVTDHKLPVVAPGVIQKQSSISLDQAEPFHFTAEVEVEPEISVRHYQGIKAEKEIHPVEEEQVDHVIEMIREQRAEFEPVESGAEIGFFIEGDVQVLDRTGLPVIGQKWTDRIFELGKPPLEDATEDLLGVKAGEERRFHVRPRDADGSPAEDEAQHYLIHVHAVKKKNLPGLDDDFAKKIGQLDTLDELRTRIRNNIAAEHEEASEAQLRRRIADEIIRKNDFEVPPAMIRRALDSMWESYRDEHPEAEEEAYKSHFRPEVVRSLKWEMLWNRIAETESITITEEALQEEIDRTASASPKEERKIRALFKEEWRRRRLRGQLLEEATMQFIKAHGKIKEVTVKPAKKNASKIIRP
ncbi:MAG TPA: trigger factor [bacterium]|nr:trigger factor [bacterium]